MKLTGLVLVFIFNIVTVVAIAALWWRFEIRIQRERNELHAEMELTHRQWDRGRDPDFEPPRLRHGSAPSRDYAP